MEPCFKKGKGADTENIFGKAICRIGTNSPGQLADAATLSTDMTSQQHHFEVILMEKQCYYHISCQADPNQILDNPSTTL